MQFSVLYEIKKYVQDCVTNYKCMWAVYIVWFIYNKAQLVFLMTFIQSLVALCFVFSYPTKCTLTLYKF